jgi:tetratricopeptide (TPR) repeat protein
MVDLQVTGCRATFVHALRFTFHVSRFTFHVSRFTFHVSRITFQNPILFLKQSPMSTISPQDPTYNALFLRYISTGLRQSLERVQATAPLISEAERQQAWHLLSYGLAVDSTWPEVRDLLLTLAPIMEQTGFRDEWMVYLEQGMAQARTQGDVSSAGQIAIQLGLLNQLVGRYTQADEGLQQTVKLLNDGADPHHRGVAYNLLANGAIRRGQPDEANVYMERALATLPEDDPDLAYTAYVRGDIALFERDYIQAEDHFRHGLALRRQQNDSRRIAMALRNLALALQHLGRYDESIQCSEEAIHRFEELDDIRNRATACVNLSLVYHATGDFAQALALLTSAEPGYRRTGDDQALAQLFTNRGIYARKIGRLQEAEESEQEAIALWERLGDLGNLINALDGLGLTFLAQKRYSEAVQIFERAIALLPKIVQHPRHVDYQQELQDHLAEARQFVTP